MVRRPIIFWEYGLRLSDNVFLVSEVKRLKEELANFNWDYMLQPSIYSDKMIKVTDPDKIDSRYEWLTLAVRELEKECKERGIFLSPPGSSMKEIYEWEEPYQGRQRAYLVKTDNISNHEVGYYKWQNKVFFAVCDDGKVTGYRESLKEIKEIVSRAWKDSYSLDEKLVEAKERSNSLPQFSSGKDEHVKE